MSTPAITRFDKSTLRTVDQAALEALKPVLAKMGLDVSLNGGSFTSSEAVLRFKIQFAKGSEQAESATRAEFDKNCDLFGLKPEHFGKTITNDKGQTFRISGIALTRSKYPIKATDPSGKEFVFTVGAVRQALGIRPGGA